MSVWAVAAAVSVALVLVVAGMLSRIGNGGGIFNFLMTGQGGVWTRPESSE